MGREYDGVLQKIAENTSNIEGSKDYTNKLDTVITAINDNTQAINDLVAVLTPEEE